MIRASRTVSGDISQDESPFNSAFFDQLENLKLIFYRRTLSYRPGEHRGQRYGSSLDFVDFRPYTQGDELRLIDWNIYGRLDRLVIKLFNEERDLCLHLLIDSSDSMAVGRPSKWFQAAQIAGVLAYIGLANHERITLGTLGGLPLARRGIQSGLKKITDFLHALENIVPAGTNALGETLSRYAHAQRRTGGVVIIISDLLDPIEEIELGLRALVFCGFEVKLLQILSQEELNPNLEGDLRLLPWEKDASIPAREVSINARTLAQYQANLTATSNKLSTSPTGGESLFCASPTTTHYLIPCYVNCVKSGY